MRVIILILAFVLGSLSRVVYCASGAASSMIRGSKGQQGSGTSSNQNQNQNEANVNDRYSNNNYDPLLPVPDEQALIGKLLRNYDPASRPVYNASHAVVIKFGLALIQICDMDERNQILTTNVWLEQDWVDERLKWNKSDYNNLDKIRIPCNRIWLPDIVLYNSADDYTEGYMQSKAMVTPDGRVFWPPPAKLRSSCVIDVTFFPFDDQVCNIKFGSWTYSGLQVDLTNKSESVDLTNYIKSGEWDLKNVIVERNVQFYPCCPDEPYPDVVFYIYIRRRILYYLFNIILPCVWLSILSLVGFWLPPDSGEKITLGITVLLAFSVFMLLIAENIPATSEMVPLIGIYLTTTMSLTSMSIVLTVLVLHLHHAGQFAPVMSRKFYSFMTRSVAYYVGMESTVKRYEATYRKASGVIKRSCGVKASLVECGNDLARVKVDLEQRMWRQQLNQQRQKNSEVSTDGCLMACLSDDDDDDDDDGSNIGCQRFENRRRKQEKCGCQLVKDKDGAENVSMIDGSSSSAASDLNNGGTNFEVKGKNSRINIFDTTELRGLNFTTQIPNGALDSSAFSLTINKSPTEPRKSSNQTFNQYLNGYCNDYDKTRLHSHSHAFSGDVKQVESTKNKRKLSRKKYDILVSQSTSGGSNKNVNSIDTYIDSLNIFSKYLKEYLNRENANQSNSDLQNEWKLVALIVDRVLFWMFSFVTVVSSLILLVILPILKNRDLIKTFHRD